MKTFKRLLWILGAVAVIAVALVFIVLSNLDDIVAAAIERYGSEATGTPVEVEGVRIDLRQGQGSIAGLTVANPAGFSTPHAFSLGRIGTAIDLASVREDPVVIEEIVVQSPAVTYEVDAQGRSNVQALKERLAGSREAGGAPAGEGQPSAAPNLLVKRLVIEQGRLDARVAALGDRELGTDLPRIEMTDLGGPSGAPPEQIAREILERLLERVRAAARDLGIERQLEQRLDQEKRKLREDVQQRLDDELGDALQRLR